MTQADALNADIPRLYSRWAESFLGGPIPPETLATCHACAMVKPPGSAPIQNGLFFDPELVCCTFFPSLPNFLVGNILADKNRRESPVHSMVRRPLDAEGLVTPLGIYAPQKYMLIYSHDKLGFGNDSSLRCPYLEKRGFGDSPGCSIWPHRQSVCTSWFCKFVRGSVGRKFWREMLNLLSCVENCLTWWCILQLNFPDTALKRLTTFDADHGVETEMKNGRLGRELEPRDFDALWGPWEGRRSSFYKAAGRLVAGLKWTDIERIGGIEIAVPLRLVQDAYRKLTSDEIPDRLRVGNLRVLAMGPENSLLAGYVTTHPLEVPNKLLRVLKYFDGRSTDEAVAAIASNEKIRLSRGLIGKLVDHAILEQA